MSPVPFAGRFQANLVMERSGCFVANWLAKPLSSKRHFTASLSIVVPRTRHAEYEDEADKQNQQTHHFRLFQNGTL